MVDFAASHKGACLGFKVVVGRTFERCRRPSCHRRWRLDGEGRGAGLCAAASEALEGLRPACCKRAVRRLRPTRTLCRQRTALERGTQRPPSPTLCRRRHRHACQRVRADGRRRARIERGVCEAVDIVPDRASAQARCAPRLSLGNRGSATPAGFCAVQTRRGPAFPGALAGPAASQPAPRPLLSAASLDPVTRRRARSSCRLGRAGRPTDV